MRKSSSLAVFAEVGFPCLLDDNKPEKEYRLLSSPLTGKSCACVCTRYLFPLVELAPEFNSPPVEFPRTPVVRSV
ncbi:hypothetical protein DMENIID0001_059270 [Sergentomyia squamirostris]